MTRLRLSAASFAAVAFAAALSATPARAAPQCVEMRFLDAKGVVVPVTPPLIGIMIGDTPLFEGLPPVAASATSGRILPCPDALVASTQKVFNESCTSDERRQKAAAANRADMATINRRCADLTKTLAK